MQFENQKRIVYNVKNDRVNFMRLTDLRMQKECIEILEGMLGRKLDLEYYEFKVKTSTPFCEFDLLVDDEVYTITTYVEDRENFLWDNEYTPEMKMERNINSLEPTRHMGQKEIIQDILVVNDFVIKYEYEKEYAHYYYTKALVFVLETTQIAIAEDSIILNDMIYHYRGEDALKLIPTPETDWHYDWPQSFCRTNERREVYSVKEKKIISKVAYN